MHCDAEGSSTFTQVIPAQAGTHRTGTPNAEARLQPPDDQRLMDITETLYVATREAWRAWLAAHHETTSEIWLVSYRQHVGRPSVPYNDAVEEALCFGWIDSTRKGIDDERFAQRYTPRRPTSGYSQLNKERLARLLDRDRVVASVAEAVCDVRAEDFHIPDDIRAALQREAGAWDFFQSTSPSYQRIRAAYVDGARAQPDVFAKRLAHLVDKCAAGKQFGYGIESYY
ncbi:MAG: YdeI/OmpD-associated family protein [Rhodothermales bacterium]